MTVKSPLKQVIFERSLVYLRPLLERLLDLRDARVLLHHQEVRLPVLVQLSDPAEQEARAGVLVADHSDQFSAARHPEAARFGSARINRSYELLRQRSRGESRGQRNPEVSCRLWKQQRQKTKW